MIKSKNKAVIKLCITLCNRKDEESKFIKTVDGPSINIPMLHICQTLYNNKVLSLNAFANKNTQRGRNIGVLLVAPIDDDRVNK